MFFIGLGNLIQNIFFSPSAFFGLEESVTKAFEVQMYPIQTLMMSFLVEIGGFHWH
jgi:hypothetical protein